MADCITPYLGECCEDARKCSPSFPVIEAFNITLDGITPSSSQPYFAWANPQGGTLISRFLDRGPRSSEELPTVDQLGNLKAGRWLMHYSPADPSGNAGFDYFKLAAVNGDAEFNHGGITFYAQLGLGEPDLTPGVARDFQIDVPCETLPQRWNAVIAYQHRSGLSVAGLTLNLVGTWLSDPP